MSRQNHDDLRNDWYKISGRIGAINSQLASLASSLLARTGEGTDNENEALLKLIERVSNAMDEISGLSYLCYPQTE